MLVINPEECIDCNLCIPECPVNAIYSEDDLPEDQQAFLEINERLSQQWPVIDTIKPAPNDADTWQNVPGKRQYLDEGEAG
jgi:ferredoxin